MENRSKTHGETAPDTSRFSAFGPRGGQNSNSQNRGRISESPIDRLATLQSGHGLSFHRWASARSLSPQVMQQFWKYGIPKTLENVGERINLPFRMIGEPLPDCD